METDADATTTDPHADAPTLTCVDCGYALTGLAASGTCPECGRSIDDSRAAADRPVDPVGLRLLLWFAVVYLLGNWVTLVADRAGPASFWGWSVALPLLAGGLGFWLVKGQAVRRTRRRLGLAVVVFLLTAAGLNAWVVVSIMLGR